MMAREVSLMNRRNPRPLPPWQPPPSREGPTESGSRLTDEGAYLLLRLPLPPVSPENIHVEVGERQVIIRGQHKESTELRGDGFYRAQRQLGAFHYTIALPAPVLPSAAEAGFDEGILTVTLPKADPA